MKHTTNLEYRGKSFAFRHFGPGDHISRSLINSNWYEQSFLEYLYTFAPQGGTYVDVGAYIGTHSVFFAEYLASEVVAFEPNYESARLLVENTDYYRHVCTVFDMGITLDGRGVVLEEDEANRGNTRLVGDPNGMLTINPEELRDILDGHKITLIKIDVEGMQNEVFAAFFKLIEQHRPWVAIECTEQQVNGYLGMLDNYEYVKRFGATYLYLIKPKEK